MTLAILVSASACITGDQDALALIDVVVDPGVPTFDQVWFSVEGRPAAGPRILRRTDRAFGFGYYIAGVKGPISVKAQARQGEGCVVGDGSATPVLAPGKTSARVTLTIAPVANRSCATPTPAKPLAPGQVFDGPAPDDIDQQSSNQTMSAHWSGFGENAGYEYKIASTTDCEGTPLHPPTRVGKGSTYSAFNLMLPDARVYNCIRSFDDAGNTSPWVASDGVEIDRGAPTVIEYRPAHQAAKIKRDQPIVVVFSEPLDPKSVTGQIQLANGATALPFTIEVDPTGATVTVRPDKKLPMLAALTLTVGAEVRDLAGNAISRAATATFTTADGTWAPPVELYRYDDTSNSSDLLDLKIAAAADGRATVVWEQVHARAGISEMTALYARRFDGAAWLPADKVAESRFGRADQPALVMNDRGGVVLLFRQALDANGPIAILGNSFDLQRGWQEPRGFEATPAGVAVSEPELAIGKVGRAIGVWSWQAEVPDAPPGVQPPEPPAVPARISSTSHYGIEFLPAEEIGTKFAGLPSKAVTKDLPQIAVDPLGNAHAIWIDKAMRSLVSARYTPTGGWGAQVTISQPAQGLVLPFLDLAVDAQGNATALWVEDSVVSPGLIHAAQYAVATGKWGAPTTGSANITFGAQIAGNSAGQAVAAWLQPPEALAVRRLERGVWAPNSRTQPVFGPHSIGIDDSGHALLMWRRGGPAAMGQPDAVFVVRETASAGFEAPVQLNKEPAQVGFGLAVLPDGRAFAVWREGPPTKVMVAHFD